MNTTTLDEIGRKKGVIKLKLDAMDKELFEKNHNFFRKYIGACESRSILINALSDDEDLTLRRMLNSIERLITLADDMDKIRPGRKDLSIFFILTCIEAVYTLTNSTLTNNKQGLVIDFFTNYLDQDESDYLFSRITIISAGDQDLFVNPITSEIFALLLLGIRNSVAHEGNYWSIDFKERENSSEYICSFKSKLRKDEGHKEITYQIGITYKRLKEICVMGLIRYAKTLISNP